MTNQTPVGKTKTQGWEIGVRRTFPVSPEQAWAVLMTSPGLDCWLGDGAEPPFKKGDTFITEDGTCGEIRSASEGDLVRMRWQPRGWNFESTLQLRVIPARTGAIISIHHEMLQNQEQREAMRQHWTEVMDKLADLMQSVRR
ncbi:MAG: SRPBCC domain-containing protein [Anaerolineae bacterium]|nr:SRPBCC domain-containing protein [Anaerolineae bacterium]